MAGDRFKIDPTIANMVGNSKRQNYGHAIAKMFNDLGEIEDQKLEVKNKKLENDTKQLQYQSVADTIADKKVVSEYIASESDDLSSWLEDNKKTLKTPEWQLKATEISENRMNEVWDEALAGHENYLKENNLFLSDDGNINMSELRMQLAKDPQNLHLAQAFERKYGVKLTTPPKPKKETSLSDQLKLNNYMKEQKEDIKLEKDLVGVRENYKELFGKEMSTAQELAYKKDGELPYKVYGSTKMKPKDKELIDANIEVEKALSKLDNYTYEEIDSVVGFFQGRNFMIAGKDAVDQLEPKQKEILTILGHINSDKMHELYGAALTGGEIGRAKTWNLDTGQSTEALITAVNELRAKNTIQFENNTHGVHGVPMDGMSFGQFKIPSEDDTTPAPKPQEQKSLSEADKDSIFNSIF